MRNILCMLIVFAATLLASQKGETVLFSENWEGYPEVVAPIPDGDAKWKTVIHPNGRPFGIWGISHSGTRALSHTTAGVTSGKPRDWLICKKPLTISALGGRLSYWVQAGKPQNYEVRISQTTAADTTKFTDLIFNSATTSTTWEEKNFNLAVYAGKTIYMAFKRKGPYGMTYGSNWIIDDIKVVTYTQDQEAPVCNFVTGNLALAGKPMSLSVNVYDQTAVDSVYAVTSINNQTTTYLAHKNNADSTTYDIEIPASGSNDGTIHFITKDKSGNRGTSVDFNLIWGNNLLNENFEEQFPPNGWKNISWKQSEQYGANNTKCAYCSYASNGTLTTYPIKLTADTKLSFYVANRYFSMPGGGKVVGEDSIFCEISNNMGANWQTILTYSPETPDTQHQRCEIDMSPLTGQQVLLRWRHSTNETFDAEGALIDSVLIYSNLTGIANVENIISAKDITSAYPNPFNPETTINFNLINSGTINLSVYNNKGEIVRTMADSYYTKGAHSLKFNAAGLNSGVYFYKLTTANGCLTNKILLVK